MTSYLIPDQSLSVETEVRKSRFICHLGHAETADQAREFIASIKQQHADATHNCWAFQTEQPGSSRSIGCSDDGEPHGSAGKPMLNILSHAEIGEIVAVVTRYYGGTKLGTGGLARAYSDSVKSALAQLVSCEKIEWQFATLTVDYSLQPGIEKIVQDMEAEIIELQFNDKVTIKIRYDDQSLDAINKRLSNISQGQLKINKNDD